MNPCLLTTANTPTCPRPGLVEIEDRTGARAWGCPSHTLRALRAIDSVHIVRDLRTGKGDHR